MDLVETQGLASLLVWHFGVSDEGIGHSVCFHPT